MAKVLVVDDEEIIRGFLRVHFEGAGYDVIEAANGETALTLANDESPDLIVMDMNMPVMTGWDAVKALKQDGLVTAGVPIIALTAHNTPDDHAAAHEAGCDAFVEKPIDPDRLMDAVSRVLG
ncbi:MAG: response regulator [Rhodospirillales bacterium]|nr:response regulator [Rhodospirillales bacterium]